MQRLASPWSSHDISNAFNSAPKHFDDNKTGKAFSAAIIKNFKMQ